MIKLILKMFMLNLFFNLLMINYALSLSFDSRIVIGWKGNISNYPFAVQITSFSSSQYTHLCGGSIIGDYWVLTAAHCVKNITYQNLRVMYGVDEYYWDDYNINDTREVSHRIIHEDYDRNFEHEHDISLIKVKKIFPNIHRSKPISLIKIDEIIESKYSLFVGFSGERTKFLTVTNVQTKNHSFCDPGNVWPDDRIICGTWSKDAFICRDDSGSSLISLRENSQKFLIGILSGGKIIGEKCIVKPIFTRISYYLNWIKKKMIDYE